MQRTKQSRRILNNKTEELKISRSNTYYKSTVIKVLWYWYQDRQTVELNRNSHTYSNFIYKKVTLKCAVIMPWRVESISPPKIGSDVETVDTTHISTYELKTELPYDPAISFQGIYPENTQI